MQTIASMKEYINEYVRSQPLHKTGYELLETYSINHVAMGEDDTKEYIKEFFEQIDVATTKVIC